MGRDRASSATSACAPANVRPVTDQNENEQKKSDDQQSARFGSVSGMVMPMLIVSYGFGSGFRWVKVRWIELG